MPLPFTLPLGVLIGSLFALSFRKRRGTPPVPEAERWVLAYALFVFLPVAAYAPMFHPGWAFCYLIPHAPSALSLVILLCSTAATHVAFLVTRARMEARAPAALAVPIVGSLCVLGTLAVALRARIRVEGTYAQYHGDFGLRPLQETSLGAGALLAFAALALSFAWLLWHANRRSLPSA